MEVFDHVDRPSSLCWACQGYSQPNINSANHVCSPEHQATLEIPPFLQKVAFRVDDRRRTTDGLSHNITCKCLYTSLGPCRGCLMLTALGLEVVLAEYCIEVFRSDSTTRRCWQTKIAGAPNRSGPVPISTFGSGTWPCWRPYSCRISQDQLHIPHSEFGRWWTMAVSAFTSSTKASTLPCENWLWSNKS